MLFRLKINRARVILRYFGGNNLSSDEKHIIKTKSGQQITIEKTYFYDVVILMIAQMFD